MTSAPARERLRDLLNSREIVLAPGLFDGMSAQLVRRTGHDAAYLTGAGVAATVAASAITGYHRPEKRDNVSMAFTGRVWVFGDSLDTDAMYPGFCDQNGPVLGGQTRLLRRPARVDRRRFRG